MSSLKPVIEHGWDLEPNEAIALQEELAALVRVEPAPEPITHIAGIDVSLRQGLARSAVVVFTFPELDQIETVCAEAPIAYPYVPGLLSFREIPVILDALADLTAVPDVLMCDAQGLAHPRRMGLASHLGLILDHPAIGCAKSRLCGEHEEPAAERGAWTPLHDGDEVIGAVVRTRTNVRPLYVSVGHRVTLEDAIDLTLACGRGYRLPEPTRWADKAAAIKRT